MNLLQNGDFESNAITPWSSSGGSAEATISSELVHNGAYSIQIRHDKTSSYGFQQTIQNIEEGMFYEAAGYGATKDTNVASYLLRVAWYSSADGSGSQITTPVDTESATNTDGQWSSFRVLVQSPSNAKSAKIRLVLTAKISGTGGSVYFDDVLFQESVAPTNTPTQTPTQTPTHTCTPKPANTATPTLTKTPTGKPSATTIPILNSSQQNRESSESAIGHEDTSDILGSSSAIEDTGVPDQEASASSRSPLYPLIIISILLGAACALLSFAFVLYKQFWEG